MNLPLVIAIVGKTADVGVVDQDEADVVVVAVTEVLVGEPVLSVSVVLVGGVLSLLAPVSAVSVGPSVEDITVGVDMEVGVFVGVGSWLVWVETIVDVRVDSSG